MKALHKRDFPTYFAKGKKLFHIIVHMSDAPGSLVAILDLLRQNVNLIGISTYTLNDGSAMLSAFAEALTPKETPAVLQQLLGQSKATLESEVREGHDGLLVDTFHTGLNVGGEDYFLARRDGVSEMFNHIVKIFGSGGEVLLFEEGKALGRENARKRVSELGVERVREEGSYLAKALAAQGWGNSETLKGRKTGEIVLEVTDCFECCGGPSGRKGCHFYRGFLEGSAEITSKVPVKSEEIQCTFKGAKACVFRLTFPKEQ